MKLTPRLEKLLTTLTHKVCCLSLSQVMRLIGSDSEKSVKRWLQNVESEGLLATYHAMIQTIPLEAPLIIWKPGDREPDFDQLAQRVGARWKNVPLRSTLMISATKEAVAVFGGHSMRPKETEMTHHLHVTEIWLSSQLSEDKAQQRRAKRWVSEAQLYSQGCGRDGRALPDAAIEGKTGRTLLDFLGEYRKGKIVELFDELSAGGDYTIELW